jgi:peroxiredoxin
VGWLSALSIYQLLGLIGGLIILGLLAAQWWFIFGLFRQNGRLLARLAAVEERLIAAGLTPTASQNESQTAVGLPVGASAPAFGLQDPQGEEVTLDSLLALGKPVVLLFTDPACGPCAELLPEIAYWQREYADELTISLISRGTADENLAESSEHGLTGVLLQEDREVFESYRAYGTPSAVLVRPDGTIGSTLVGGEEAIEHLVAQAAEVPTWVPLLPGTPATTEAADHGKAHPAAPRTRKVGEPAPFVELPDLAGNTVKLEQFRGKEILVLFWNLGCGFCQQMLPDLQEWEENSPEGVPELLVVSTGTKEANEEMRLGSPVVLDQGFSAGRAFGAVGTPSAVLIDAEGRVASEVAAGAPAVLELLTRSGRTAA